MRYIDLHAHLDGSITVPIAQKLAKMQSIPLPDDEKLKNLIVAPENCKSLNDFLKCFSFPLSLLQTEKSVSEAVNLVLCEMQNEGIVYAEIMFAPQLHTQNGISQENIVLSAIEGLKKAPICANLLLCLMRGNGNESENRETLCLAEKYLVQNGGVTGINLAGAEALYPTQNYTDILNEAKKRGIPMSVHAGEADGAQSVKTAIDAGAVRIGHGVRAYEDEDVLCLIKEKGITLEMCPTSNKITKAVADMRNYPFMKYLDMGIKVTINTDDKAIENTTIAREFEYMEKNFSLSRKQKTKVLENAVNSAFTTDEVKEKLKKLIVSE